MTIIRKLTSMTTAVALGATALLPISTAASAEGWHDSGRRNGYSQRYDGGRDYRGYDRGRYDRYAYRRHRHNDTGKYIALGVGALMLGIIASEASRH